MYNNCNDPVRSYFEHLPSLLAQFPLEVALAYAFSRLELGQNRALYAGVIKLHRVNADVATNVINTHHMTRKEFVQLYKTVFGFSMRESALNALGTAESTRDTIMHGKSTTSAKIRNALAGVLEYAEAMNNQLYQRCEIRPYGDLRGITGRAKKHDKRTSSFVLKGMGFTGSVMAT